MNTATKTLTFTKNPPTCDGQYLIKWGPDMDNEYELIKVVSRDSQLFVSAWGGKNICDFDFDIAEGIAKL